MKRFEGCTYYEVLKIPHDADRSIIQAAYREAMAIYGEDALATYSLFSDDQRADLLQTIETAYHTLVDPDGRERYDRSLIEQGHVDASRPSDGAAIPANHKGVTKVARRDLAAWVKKRYAETACRQLAEEVVGQEVIPGTELKRLRLALDIRLEEIFAQTRISQSMLKAIEESQVETLPAEIFLRSFLKNIAGILQIDAQRVVDGYLKHLSLIDAGT